jgi:uncharacterized protein YjbI with pentapeptide repeats
MPPDYSGQNLRGRSFKGQNLTGANFSKADIRGANFTNAILKDADFTGVMAGLQKRWKIILVIVSLLLLLVSGFISAVIGGWVGVTLSNSSSSVDNYFPGFAAVISLILLAIFLIFSIRQGLVAASRVLVVAAGVTTLSLAAVVVIAGFKPDGSVSGIIAGIVTAAATAVVFGAVAGVIVDAVAGKVAAITAVVMAETVVVVVLAGTVAVELVETMVGLLAVLVAVLVAVVSAWICWEAVRGDENQAFIFSIAIPFAATGGTSFCNADLTDADFTGATLKNTDLRKSNLTRTRFYEAKKLDFARVDNSILANRGVLNLLVTGNGRGKSYADANLKGANLIGADLKEANLKDADITEATFQGACLERANLTLAQAVGTNFTSAQMTGACVEAWNIESTTKLDNVDCRFIYLLENPKSETDDRERRPSSGEFQPGEFSKLFEEVLNTVDLIFRDGIDWRAFVNAFQTVQDQNEGTELALQSIENKGDGVVVVKVGVPDGADKEKIHSDFTQNYQLALQAVEEKYKAQLQAKDEQIVIYRQTSGEMTEIVKLLANKPINVQVDNKVENKNMTNSNDASRKIEIGSVGRDFNASGQALNLGDISGTVTNTINQLPASSESDKPGIKELLTQLQAAIEADTNLPQEDKAEALEQVKALAEAGKNPQEGAMQKAAKTAIKILKGTISSLPSATKLVEDCSNLLPLISNFLGLG